MIKHKHHKLTDVDFFTVLVTRICNICKKWFNLICKTTSKHKNMFFMCMFLMVKQRQMFSSDPSESKPYLRIILKQYLRHQTVYLSPFNATAFSEVAFRDIKCSRHLVCITSAMKKFEQMSNLSIKPLWMNMFTNQSFTYEKVLFNLMEFPLKALVS